MRSSTKVTGSYGICITLSSNRNLSPRFRRLKDHKFLPWVFCWENTWWHILVYSWMYSVSLYRCNNAYTLGIKPVISPHMFMYRNSRWWYVFFDKYLVGYLHNRLKNFNLDESIIFDIGQCTKLRAYRSSKTKDIFYTKIWTISSLCSSSLR